MSTKLSPSHLLNLHTRNVYFCNSASSELKSSVNPTASLTLWVLALRSCRGVPSHPIAFFYNIHYYAAWGSEPYVAPKVIVGLYTSLLVPLTIHINRVTTAASDITLSTFLV
jgi:hypothetical protein